MKVGDTFVDNGRVMKVIEQANDGSLISKFVCYEYEVKKEAKVEAEEVKEEAPKKRGRKPMGE